MAKTTIDVKGLCCPLPVLRANRAVKDLEPGDLLEVIATDPGAPPDFEVFCKTAGHELLESSEEDGVFTMIVRKGNKS